MAYQTTTRDLQFARCSVQTRDANHYMSRFLIVVCTVLTLVIGLYCETNYAHAQTRRGHDEATALALAPRFPTEVTSGVPEGTRLTVYTGPMKITTSGTVIDGKAINGTLIISAEDVTIKNSRLVNGEYWGIDAENVARVTIQDCDIIGNGQNGNSGILGTGNIIRNDISGYENGIMNTGRGGTIRGNYIHDLKAAGSNPHYDGIQIMGPAGALLIDNNTILSQDTSNIFIANAFGEVDNVVINNNYLAGGPGYAIYVDASRKGGPVTNVAITNNYVVKGGWGYYSFEKSTPKLSGNIEVDGASQVQVRVPDLLR